MKIKQYIARRSYGFKEIQFNYMWSQHSNYSQIILYFSSFLNLTFFS